MATFDTRRSPGTGSRRNDVLMLDEFEEIVGVPVSDPEGLIISPYRDMPLECLIKKWLPGPTLGRTNTLQLIWRVGGVDVVADEFVFDETSYAAAFFPYPLHVPVDYMLDFDAVIALRYRIKEEGSPDVDSPSRPLRLDRNAPVFTSPSDTPHFDDPTIVASGITEAVLLANEYISVILPPFTVRAAGDRVALYLSDETPPFPSIPTLFTTFNFTDDPLVIEVHRDFFRALPNGTAYLTARAFDRSGNYSPLSASSAFQVNLIPSPADLPAPDIRPPAYLDLLLKRDDARAGIAARIPSAYTGYMPGDQVVMIWDGRSVLPAVTITGFPFAVTIPWSILRVPGPLVREHVPVRYEIHRPGISPFPSPVAFFWVDWTLAGQDHAGAPALLNPTLAPVRVIGNGSGLTNELDIRDQVSGASVWVRLYVDPQPGEVLALYWGSRGPLAYYTVQTGDVFDQLVQFVPIVSGADIVAEGNHPALPVFYTTSNGVNEQHAPETLVNVHVDPPVALAAPIIGHTKPNGVYVTCESVPAICHGVRWTVPADTHMQLNDEVRFFWQGFLNNNWSSPIDGTDFEAQVLVNADHLVNGVLFVVLPWETKVEPMRDFASATATYYVYRGGALIGESSVGRVRLDRKYPGSGNICQPGDVGFCDGTDVQWLETPQSLAAQEAEQHGLSHSDDFAANVSKLSQLLEKLIRVLQAFTKLK